MLCNMSYWAPELHGSMAPWLLGLLGCQVLYESSYLALLRLGYVAPELHGSLALSSSFPWKTTCGFNSDLWRIRMDCVVS